MSILANQDGIWKSKDIRIDHMSIEIMCTDLRDNWISGWSNIRKLFFISRPPGGAIKGRCEKDRAKVFSLAPRWCTVHTKLYTGRSNYREKQGSACYSATLRLM